jgi:cell wall-associated NlpC family hydrolase
MMTGGRHPRWHRGRDERRRRRWARPVGTLLAVSLFLVVPGARADSVSDQAHAVQQIASELNRLNDRISQLSEAYGAAQDRQTALSAEIATAQTRVDAEQANLAQLQGTLTDMAVNRFVGNNGHELSPLFSNASNYSTAQQYAALSDVALDAGATTADDAQSVVRQLSLDTQQLRIKMAEAGTLVTTLAQQRAEGDQLVAVYTQKAAAAQIKYGQLVQQEADRQAELVAKAAAQKAAAQAAAQAAIDAAHAAAKQAAQQAAASPKRPTAPAPTTTLGRARTSARPGAASGAAPPSTRSAPTSTDPAPVDTAPVDTTPVSGKAAIAVAAARSMLGVPYRAFQASPQAGFDCSGLTMWAWAQAGVHIPHQSGQQYATLPHVPIDQAQPGDLVFFYSPISHVGIYIGGGAMIDSPHTGAVVRIRPMRWDMVVGVARPG